MTNRFIFIHIGKCGGTTVRLELNKNAIRFHRQHIRKISLDKEFKYLIIIRNPVKRFISAFNWRYKLLVDEKGQESRRIFDNEAEILAIYGNLTNLGEQLYTSENKLNNKVVNHIKNIHHMREDIYFYIGDFLGECGKENILGVLTTHNLAKDMRRVFKIDKIQHIRKNNGNYDKTLSPLAYHNIKKYLKKDYTCIRKLRRLGLVSKHDYHILSK